MTTDVRPYEREPTGTHAPLASAAYRSTGRRAPQAPPVPLRQTLTEVTAPVFPEGSIDPGEADLTRRYDGEPVGERIIVTGRVLDDRGEPVANSLVEIWQANAAGRYAHPVDTHPAPLDPNFTGCGRCLTDRNGRWRFSTIKPGAYPWKNAPNAWRPAHIHFSVLGPALATRLVTQMYFPGDPLLEHDAILNAVPAPARPRLVAGFDFDVTEPEWALGYRWDIVLRGRHSTPGGM